MSTIITADTKTLQDIFALRNHIIELEGVEAKRIKLTHAKATGKDEKHSSLKRVQEGIAICTRQGSMIDGNQALLDILGYTIEEFFGLNIIDLCVNAMDGIQFLKLLDDRGYVVDHKIKLQRKDGSEIYCMLTSTIRWYNDENIPDNQPLFKMWIRPIR